MGSKDFIIYVNDCVFYFSLFIFLILVVLFMFVLYVFVRKCGVCVFKNDEILK